VHLAEWPVADPGLVDAGLESAMTLTRRLVELGRAARAEAKVKTRQPLARALVAGSSYAVLTDELRAEICAELNIGEVGTFADASGLVDYSVKANFRSLGKRFGQQTPVVAAAVADADAAGVAAAVSAGQPVVLDVPGIGSVALDAEDVLVSERPREGWSVLNEQGETIALDLELTPELVSAGLAREAIRLIQEARKSSGFDVSDRITLVWQADSEPTAAAIREHESLISDEVLAVEVLESPPAQGSFTDEDLGLKFAVARV
jgi:isoleucyl-tRNA synthetase